MQNLPFSTDKAISSLQCDLLQAIDLLLSKNAIPWSCTSLDASLNEERYEVYFSSIQATKQKLWMDLYKISFIVV